MQLSTPQRAALLDLLGDDTRLRREFPKVAEYLSAAPHLPGTGLEEEDADFDLRMTAYLTGVAPSQNPYWEIVKGMVSSTGTRPVVNGHADHGSGRLAYAQTVLQETYAFALPSPETLQWVRKFCDDLPMVEVGAGRGYWANLISKQGVPIRAFDVAPPGNASNPNFPDLGSGRKFWHPVRDQAEFDDQDDWTGHVLLLCWPPGWENSMAVEALDKFSAKGGSKLVYIGEPRGGKTASAAFFEALSARWTLLSHDEAYVSWWNSSDLAQGWTLRN